MKDLAVGQRESRLSRDIMKALRLKGVFCFKVHGGPTMMNGLPDIIACVEGKFYGLEVKLPGNAEGASPTQLLVHGQIVKAGGRAHIVSSIPEALRVCGL